MNFGRRISFPLVVILSLAFTAFSYEILGFNLPNLQKLEFTRTRGKPVVNTDHKVLMGK